MEKLLAYINSLDADQRERFARDIGSSIGYLRRIASNIKKGEPKRLGETKCLLIQKHSRGRVTVEDLRPAFAITLAEADYTHTSAAIQQYINRANQASV